MGCSKGSWKNQIRAELERRLMMDIQVFQNREFPVEGINEPLQFRNRNLKADAAHAITVLQRKSHSLFVFCGDVMSLIELMMRGKGGQCASITGRQQNNMLRNELLSRIWIGVLRDLLSVGRISPKKLIRHREHGAYLGR
jgi:hypothetical protein